MQEWHPTGRTSLWRWLFERDPSSSFDVLSLLHHPRIHGYSLWRMIFCRSLKRTEPFVDKAIQKDCTLTKGLGDNPPRFYSATHGARRKKPR